MKLDCCHQMQMILNDTNPSNDINPPVPPSIKPPNPQPSINPQPSPKPYYSPTPQYYSVKSQPTIIGRSASNIISLSIIYFLLVINDHNSFKLGNNIIQLLQFLVIQFLFFLHYFFPLVNLLLKR